LPLFQELVWPVELVARVLPNWRRSWLLILCPRRRPTMEPTTAPATVAMVLPRPPPTWWPATPPTTPPSRALVLRAVQPPESAEQLASATVATRASSNEIALRIEFSLMR